MKTSRRNWQKRPLHATAVFLNSLLCRTYDYLINIDVGGSAEGVDRSVGNVFTLQAFYARVQLLSSVRIRVLVFLVQPAWKEKTQRSVTYVWISTASNTDVPELCRSETTIHHASEHQRYIVVIVVDASCTKVKKVFLSARSLSTGRSHTHNLEQWFSKRGPRFRWWPRTNFQGTA